MPAFDMQSELDAPADAVFDWHCRPGAFERLTPPWEPVELVSSKGVFEGSVAVIRVGLAPLVWSTWVARHQDIELGRQFRDIALTGPFSKWEHTHQMRPLADDRCLLSDHIEYQPPLGFLSNVLIGRFIRDKLSRTFAYRHRVTAQDLEFHRRATGDRTMKIAIGGSTGLVGNELVSFLTTGGHEVVRLVRKRSLTGSPTAQVQWDPAQGTIDATKLEGCDAVVHMGGDNIAHGRWTEGKKRLIHDSRTISTKLLASTLAGLTRPPKVFVCASAIGFYGDRGDDVMTEDCAPGPTFISNVCRDWEAATEPARAAGIRVVNLRFGVILTPKGAALKKMLLPFKLCGGGVVGSGRQWWSWVAIDDVLRAALHSIVTDSLVGPVNVVAPGTVTNYDFTKALGRVLHRPTILPMPAFAVRLALGEMGEELLLASSRVAPTKLQASGFDFAYPELEPALRHLLGR